jgi:hypothetical protein
MEDDASPTTPAKNPRQTVDWLLKPLLDDQAPLVLRANCIRSLALLTSTSSDQLQLLRRGKDNATPSNLSQTILNVQNQVDKVVQPFLRNKKSLGARISNVTHLHSFNLLALLLGSNSTNRTTNGSTTGSASRFATRKQSPSPSSRSPSRRRLDQSHIPEWRRMTVSPPRAGPTSPTSPSSPSSSPTRTDQFAEDFFDTMMVNHAKSGSPGGSPGGPGSTALQKQQEEESRVVLAFDARDQSTRCSLLDSNVTTSLMKQLTGPTHGVGKGQQSPHRPAKVDAAVPEEEPLDEWNNTKEAWGTPERVRSQGSHGSEWLSARFPKSNAIVSSPLHTTSSPLRAMLPPPPPSPRQNSMRPLTPTDAPFAQMPRLRLAKDQQLLEERAHPLKPHPAPEPYDETGEWEWEEEEKLRQQLRQRYKKVPPPLLTRGQRTLDREAHMMKQLTLVAPLASRGGHLSQRYLTMHRVGCTLS